MQYTRYQAQIVNDGKNQIVFIDFPSNFSESKVKEKCVKCLAACLMDKAPALSPRQFVYDEKTDSV